MARKTLISTLAVVFVLLSAIFAATHDFIPDFTFQGSTLNAWHTVGQANWRAENGEIIATPQSSEGGWLILDKGYQDIIGAPRRASSATSRGWWASAPTSGNGAPPSLIASAPTRWAGRTPQHTPCSEASTIFTQSTIATVQL